MPSGKQKHNNNTSGQETDKGQDPDAGKPMVCTKGWARGASSRRAQLSQDNLCGSYEHPWNFARLVARLMHQESPPAVKQMD